MPTPVAPIGPAAVIECIFFDGLVPRTEADEYVQIFNLGDRPANLQGWVLKDISDGTPSFTFTDYVLAGGGRVRVYTNQDHPGFFSFRRGTAIWHNTRPDTAGLFNSQGEQISTKSYPPGC